MDISMENIINEIKAYKSGECLYIVDTRLDDITDLIRDYIDQEIDNAIEAEKDCMADKEG